MSDENNGDLDKVPFSHSYVRDGLVGLIIGVVFIGWGVFRFDEHPIRSGFFVCIGILQVIFGVVNLGLAIVDRGR
jgi:hypothetical protein